MATSKQAPVFDEATDAALKNWFREALQDPQVAEVLKGHLKEVLDTTLKTHLETLKGVTLNLNEGKGKEKKNLKGRSSEQTTEKGNGKGKGFLTEAAKLALSEAGVDPDLIRFFDAWNGYAKALNNADPERGGVAGLARYFQRKDGFEARFEQWLRKNPAKPEEDSALAPPDPAEDSESAFEFIEDDPCPKCGAEMVAGICSRCRYIKPRKLDVDPELAAMSSAFEIEED